jgi:HD-GYP domain-containing protein (c-di-GMP phosphodiesterase class II)
MTHEEACRIILEGDDRTRPCHFDPACLEGFRRAHFQFAGIFDAVQEPDDPGAQDPQEMSTRLLRLLAPR